MSTEQEPASKRGRPRKRPATETSSSSWQDRLLLSPGYALRKLPRTTTGNLGQHDTENHEVINSQGQPVGTAEYHASTSLKPAFKRSYWLVQKDAEGKVIVNMRW